MRRELKEELNIDYKDIKYEFVFSYRQNAKLGSYIDNQFNDVYIGKTNFTPQSLQPNPLEVSEIKFISKNDFCKMITEKDSQIAPVYEKALVEILGLTSDFIEL